MVARAGQTLRVPPDGLSSTWRLTSPLPFARFPPPSPPPTPSAPPPPSSATSAPPPARAPQIVSADRRDTSPRSSGRHSRPRRAFPGLATETSPIRRNSVQELRSRRLPPPSRTKDPDRRRAA